MGGRRSNSEDAIMGIETCRRWARYATAIAAGMLLASCGGGSDSVSVNSTACEQASTHVSGVVEMPHGRLAASDGIWQRLAAALSNTADAITGNVSPVANATVQLVELRQQNLDDGTDPGAIALAETNGHGRFCMPLPVPPEDVCRFMLRVGSSADSTLTRAFVSSTDDVTIDYRSEATARIILRQIPPAGLCDFSPTDISNIYAAVVDAPGTATGMDVDQINAVATSLALADPGVDAAVQAALQSSD
jgi:hypothetical protein